MNSRTLPTPYPCAIGGVGGSGTRVGAALLQQLGYYIGDDLNGPLDNLWFTLLFKRRAILLASEPELRGLADLFMSRMSGQPRLTDGDRRTILSLTVDGRLQHPQEWLGERAQSFLNAQSGRRPGQPWGWKEPNTHIIIDRLFEFLPDLRYLHFARHPLDMAFSSNQNQLENWGPIFLNRDLQRDPRHSLSYWCAAHRRAVAFMARWPDRTMMVDYDSLRAAPEALGGRIADFLCGRLTAEAATSFRALLDNGRPSAGRFKHEDLSQFSTEDLSYVRALGYSL